MEKLF